jgi:hypothetical protein
MSAETLPIVCGHCREPLVFKRKMGLLEKVSGQPHFRANVCPVAWAMRAIQVAQQGWRI